MSLDSIFAAAPTNKVFTILTVCTGNICRSPLAESLLRVVLGGLPVRVESAGTHALIDSAPPEQTQRVGLDLGAADIAEHCSRQLTVEQLEGADLVLAMAKEHRAAVAELLPRAVRRTFAIREFARLAAHVDESDLDALRQMQPGEGLRAAVETVAQLRGTVERPEDSAEDDVVDPYRQADEVFHESAAQLVPAINATSSLLRTAGAKGSDA